MRKILGSVIAAVALWAGSTAYIGSQTEQELQNYITKSNALYASNGLQFKLNNYQQSFLNSTAQIEIDVTEPTLVELLSQSYELPFKIDYKIEHGPLFFQNGLGVGFSKIHHEVALSSLFKGEEKKAFLELIKGDVNITSEMIISLLKNANYTITSDTIKIKDEENQLEIAPLSITGTSNLETLKGNGSLKIPYLILKKEGTENQLKLNKLVMNIKIDEFIKERLILGAFDLKIDNLIIKDDSNPELSNINLATDLHMVMKKESESTLSTQIEGTIDFLDTKLPDNLPNLKALHAKIGASYLGIEGMMQFEKATQEMQEAQTQLITKMQEKPEEIEKIIEEFGSIQESMMEKVVQTLNALLIKDKTSLNYALEVETKDNKKSYASADIGYTGDIKFEGKLQDLALKVEQELLKMLSLNVKIDLDIEQIKAFPDSQMQIEQLKMGVTQGFIKEENGRFLLNGSYKNQELMVNDNNLTDTVLPLIIMATQGGI